MKKVNYLSLQLLLSYLSVLAVPLLAIILIYFTASRLLLSVQIERFQNSMNETAQQVDKNIEEAGNLSFYITNSRELQDLVKKMARDKQKLNYYDMYTLSRSFPDYSSFNNVISDIYIFFHNEDYMIKLPVVVPATDQSYRTLGSLPGASYEDLLKQLEKNYYQKKPLSLSGHGEKEKKLAVVQSVSYGNYDSALGAVMILLDDKFLKKKLEDHIISEEGMSFMLDHNNEILKIVKGGQCTLDPEVILSKVKSSGETTMKLVLNRKRYVLSISPETYTYRYVTVLPEKAILDQIGYMKYVIILLCGVSVLVGLSTCILLWRRKRGLILAYSHYEDEFGLAIQGEKPVKGLWEGMRTAIDYVMEIQATLRLQELFIRSAVIRKLLYGEYQSEEEIQQDLVNSQIVLEGSGYITAVISFHKIVQTIQMEKRNEYQLFMKQQIQDKVPVPNYYCELDQFTAAMILPVQEEKAFERVKGLFKAFEDDLIANQFVEAYIGIGPMVNTLHEIALSFEEAMSVCEYSKFHDIRMVMSKEDLPKEQDSFFFPMETEIHLVRAIKQGNVEDLEDIFRLIRYENFVFRKLSIAMMNHLLALIRCTVIRTLREWEEQEFQDEAEKIGNFENLEEIQDALLIVVNGIQKKRVQDEVKRVGGQKEKYRKIIEEWYHEDNFSIFNLADEFGISERKAYNDFKACFDGVTFSEYLENVRIKKACELLKQGIAVKDVAVKVGYGSDYSFRRAFKRVMGLPPSYYSEGLANDLEVSEDVYFTVEKQD